MPASLIFGGLMEAFWRELVASDSTILQVYAAAKRLHLADELSVPARISVDVLEELRDGRVRRKKQ
jgi:hypothetical protein